MKKKERKSLLPMSSLATDHCEEQCMYISVGQRHSNGDEDKLSLFQRAIKPTFTSLLFEITPFRIERMLLASE